MIAPENFLFEMIGITKFVRHETGKQFITIYLLISSNWFYKKGLGL